MSKPISDPVFDIGRDLQRAYDEGYKQGRYDEKQDAIDALEEQLDYLQMLNKDENPKAESKWYGVNWARNTIAALPSAEPERKKGEWIDYTEDGYVECPFCHSATNCDGNKDELHFCFSCGADMRGEQDDSISD